MIENENSIIAGDDQPFDPITGELREVQPDDDKDHAMAAMIPGSDTPEVQDDPGKEKGEKGKDDPQKTEKKDDKKTGIIPAEGEEKKKTRGLIAGPIIFDSMKREQEHKEPETESDNAEAIVFSFFRYTILIVGFAYAFLTLGLDLNTTTEILGCDITAANILNAILTALITAVFVIKFLPPVLDVIIRASLRNYSKRKETKEERAARISSEVEKVMPGIRKTLVYLIILFAALGALSYLDCEETLESDDSSESGSSESNGSMSDPYYYDNYDSSSTASTSKEKTEKSDLCQYVEMAEVLIRSLIILILALLLTTLTPLVIYILSTSEGDIKDSNLYKAGKYINYLIIIVALFLIMNVVGLDLDTSLALGENKISFYTVLSAILVLIITQIVAKVVVAMLRDTILNPKQIDQHASVIMEKLIYTTIICIGVAVALGTLGMNIFAIATGLGLIGFALAFGMQDTIANFMAGIMIAIERPFQIGDRIRVGDEWGDVIDIGLRSTKIRTTKNETVVIPNNLVATREVWNFTKDSPVIACVIPVGVSYDSDWEQAEDIMLEIAKMHPQVINNPPPKVIMVDFAESSIDLELWAWIANARQRFTVKSDILKVLKKRFKIEGVEIPYPHRTIVLKNSDGNPIHLSGPDSKR